MQRMHCAMSRASLLEQTNNYQHDLSIPLGQIKTATTIRAIAVPK
jgi:hypothetical protein